MFRFRVEMNQGQDMREVMADCFDSASNPGWIVFYRCPPSGGRVEYWRARIDCVVSMETARHDQ